MKKIVLYLAAAVTFGLLVFFVFIISPSKLVATTEMPDYCAKCHVMESAYEAWLHEGAHRRIKCTDCHLPNNNTGIHYIWKTIDGLKDVFLFYSGRVPEQINISAHGIKTLQANCIRCHETTVELIDQDRKCWTCHRRIMHKLSGSIETYK